MRLKLFIATAFECRTDFNANSRTCPFQRRDGLCSMQLKRGHAYLPQVCRTYPRFSRNYGPFEERYLDLSCIAAVRLFLENADDLHLITCDGSSMTDLCTTNDDTVFLDLLTGIRSDMVSALGSVRDYKMLDTIISSVHRYAADLQNACLSGDMEFAVKTPFSYESTDPSSVSVPFTISSYERLLSSSFYHGYLSYANPTLYSLCMLFFDTFRKELSTQSGWEKLASSYMQRYPEKAKLYASYFSYYLYQYFLHTYETYSFAKQVLLGIIHTNMIFMFHVLFEKKYGRLTMEDFAIIISVYDRRAYFNDNLLDDMYKVISQP